MKVPGEYVGQKIRQSIGAGTLFGIEPADGELAAILEELKSPQSAIYQNAITRQKNKKVTFPYGPDQALSLVASLSLVAETEEQAQSLLDEAFDQLRAVILEDQAAPTLSKRESMLCAGFFSLGIKAGQLIGILQDELRKKAKKVKRRQSDGGRKSPKYPPKHRPAIILALDEYIAGQIKQNQFIRQVLSICKRGPSKDTARQWAAKRRAGKPIWKEE